MAVNGLQRQQHYLESSSLHCMQVVVETNIYTRVPSSTLGFRRLG